MTQQTIPGPRTNRLLGIASQFNKEGQLPFLLRMDAEYGSRVRFRFLNRHIWMLNQPDLAREVLVRHAEQFPKGPLNERILGRFLGRGLLTNSGESHRLHRRLIQPAFHARRIAGYGSAMTGLTTDMLAGWRDGQQLDAAEAMMRLTMFIVARTLFDADVSAETEAVGHAVAALQGIANEQFRRGIVLPAWVPTRAGRQIRAGRRLVEQVLQKIIDARRDGAVDGQIVDTGDLLSMLLLTTYDDGSPLPDRQVMDEMVTLFVAGHETTSNLLSWTWYELSRQPQVEAELHAELDGVLRGRTPTVDDLPQLPYTAMVLKEALRLHPPAWILTGRQATEDVTLDDFTIPRGDLVLITPYIMHRRPELFADPLRFDPQRFTVEREARLPRYAYIPFGAGPRVCIGNSFAMLEAQLVLATVAQQYRLTLPTGYVATPQPQITLSPAGGLPVKLVARSTAHRPAVQAAAAS